MLVSLPEEPVKVAVSDGSIAILVTGRLTTPSAVERLCAELDFATAVCRGVVTVDLTGCTALGLDAALALRKHHAARYRCRFRIVACPSSMLAVVGVPLGKATSRR
ncbi:hypothetical protein [Amycolatopsis eburnea]|uniref:STAS domain-containing protein n=1 Tax=Amycolatopsis eburnea TaxID=2267691 RepID=A0A3R9KEI0_9PSEU|nr:hypothetical protein [Amycolatopsis eburnea]RSD09243.1 hypothetical protein EIY87_40030 [Amycolatopsis eburnea]